MYSFVDNIGRKGIAVSYLWTMELIGKMGICFEGHGGSSSSRRRVEEVDAKRYYLHGRVRLVAFLKS